MEHCKAGLIGIGFVGLNVLGCVQAFHSNSLKFYWFMDSESEVHKKDGSAFSMKDLEKIKTVKGKVPRGSLEEIEDQIQNFRIESAKTLDEKIGRIRELKDEVGEVDVVLDASSTRARESYEIEKSVLETASLCTANKQPWKDETFANKLIRVAKKRRFHIGLNCTVGVLVNQFEYLPLALLGLTQGQLILRKRDNASLNTFFKLIREGYRSRDAMHILFQKGYLEPGGGLTPAEILDQEYKVLIPAILAASLLKKDNVTRKHEIGIGYPENLDEIYFCTPEEIASWATNLEKKGKRAVVISKVVVDLETKEITQQLAFRGLPLNDLMSIELDGESAICMDTVSTEALRWRILHRELRLGLYGSKKEYIFNKGLGAGAITGKKLVEEALRIYSLRKELREKGESYEHYLPPVQELYTCPQRANDMITEMESKRTLGPNLTR